ncbi:MAG: HAD family phosphatase [Ruminococcaceae bacterium]|nr:HAD family phosphatase [Oscillospiraceae bacterium]
MIRVLAEAVRNTKSAAENKNRYIERRNIVKIKAAIFDMDGTLVDSLGVWNVLWARIGKKFSGKPDFMPSTEDDKRVRTLTLKDAMELIHINYGFGKSGSELLEFANELISDFYRNDVTLKKGAYEFLEHCKETGVKMCIASATATDLIKMAMEHCGLEKYFSKVFSCGEIGRGKDFPDVFLMAAEYLGEEISDTWVFEDSLVAVQTAAKAGFPTVGIYDKFNFGQDIIKETATVYIDADETLMKLIS